MKRIDRGSSARAAGVAASAVASSKPFKKRNIVMARTIGRGRGRGKAPAATGTKLSGKHPEQPADEQENSGGEHRIFANAHAKRSAMVVPKGPDAGLAFGHARHPPHIEVTPPLDKYQDRNRQRLNSSH